MELLMSVFENNRAAAASGSGGALYSGQEILLEIRTCLFDGNIAPYGMAITIHNNEPGLNLITNSTFTHTLNHTLTIGALFIDAGGTTIDYGNCTPGSTPGVGGINVPVVRDGLTEFTGCPFLCPLGTLGPGGASSSLRELVSGCALGCEVCPVGGTCAAVGLPALSLCRPGYHNPDTGSQTESSCRPCESGAFQAEAGATACEPCPAGTYAAAKGSTTCTPCAAGGYCEEVGASSASVFELCKPGTWSDTIGLNSSNDCHPCGVGTYQPISGATSSSSCLPCPPGTASNAIGVGSCALCEPGTYQPNSQASSCLPCADENLGVYCPNVGTSTPTPCPGGTHSNEIGLYSYTQCVSVEAGYWAPTGSKLPDPGPGAGNPSLLTQAP